MTDRRQLLTLQKHWEWKQVTEKQYESIVDKVVQMLGELPNWKELN